MGREVVTTMYNNEHNITITNKTTWDLSRHLLYKRIINILFNNWMLMVE